jgi:hypothetical protein
MTRKVRVRVPNPHRKKCAREMRKLALKICTDAMPAAKHLEQGAWDSFTGYRATIEPALMRFSHIVTHGRLPPKDFVLE